MRSDGAYLNGAEGIEVAKLEGEWRMRFEERWKTGKRG